MICKIGKREWVVVFIVMGILDFIQFIIIECILVWFFGIGIGINEILDSIVGILFAAYLFIRGLSPVEYWNCYASILGMAVLEEITFGVAQLWILDVWYIYRSVKKNEAKLEAQRQQEFMLSNQTVQPLNQHGVRLPQTQTVTSYGSNASNTGTNQSGGHISTYNAAPLNFDGVRAAVNTQAQTSTGTNASVSVGGSAKGGSSTSTGTSSATSSGSSSGGSGSSGGGSSGGAGK